MDFIKKIFPSNKDNIEAYENMEIEILSDNQNYQENNPEFIDENGANEVSNMQEDKEMGNAKNKNKKNANRTFTIHLGFMDGKVYIDQNGECVFSAAVDFGTYKDIYGDRWSKNRGIENPKGLHAQEGYCVSYEIKGNMDQKAKDEAKAAAKIELMEKFKVEINSAKSEWEKEKGVYRSDNNNAQNVVAINELDQKIVENEEFKLISTEQKRVENRNEVQHMGQQNHSDLRAEQKDNKPETNGKKTEGASNFKYMAELKSISIDVSDNRKLVELTKKEVVRLNERFELIRTDVGSVRDAASRSGATAVQAVKVESEKVIQALNDLGSSQKGIIKKTEKLEKLDKIAKTTEVTADMMEGITTKLEQLDTITSILSEKGVQVSRDFPPTCEEEEDIINLVRYSKRITEQLGYAARDLIRKKAHYENKDQNFANEQAVIEKNIASAREEGFVEGKLYVLKAILSKYADVDTIIESENDHVHALWALLQELDVTVDGDGEYKKGNLVKVSENSFERMSAAYKGIESVGTYRVTKTGLMFGQETLFKAEFERFQAELGENNNAENVNSDQSVNSENTDSNSAN